MSDFLDLVMKYETVKRSEHALRMTPPEQTPADVAEEVEAALRKLLASFDS